MAQTIRVNKPKGGMTASASLFSLYKEYDAGTINADKFTERLESDIGIKPTNDFQNYMRTTKGQNKCEFRKLQQTLKVADHRSQPVLADVAPYDVRFHRGQATASQPMSPRMMSPERQPHETMSKAIKDYTSGRADLGQFRLALAGGKVKIDGKLERLLRQHEAGDEQTYAKLGTLIFRQLDGACDTYNRVDKISMNDPSQVAPEKACRQFSNLEDAEQLPKRKKRVTDGLQMESEWRNSTGVYQATRGGVKRQEIFGSNLFSIINQEESRRTGGDREWAQSSKRKVVKFQGSDASAFGWDAEPLSPRSSQYAGQSQSNYDFE